MKPPIDTRPLADVLAAAEHVLEGAEVHRAPTIAEATVIATFVRDLLAAEPLPEEDGGAKVFIGKVDILGYILATDDAWRLAADTLRVIEQVNARQAKTATGSAATPARRPPRS